MASIEQRRTTVNGLDYAYLEAGPADGPLALCVHGFPDTPRGFEPLLLALADAGHRAVAPWMRGYAPTAVPESGQSALASWVADLGAFHDLLGNGRPGTLIGHDWGALATYGTAARAPQRWTRIVTGAVPPPIAMISLLGSYDQVKGFWYQYLFLRPNAEDIVAADDLEFIVRLWQDWSPGLDPRPIIQPVKEALRDPANLTAALSTYRVMLGSQPMDPVEASAHSAEMSALFMPHAQPTLYLHGSQDGCVVEAAFHAAEAVLPPGSSAVLLEGAGHFFQYEQPERVVELVLDFLGD